jgi:serine/threonine protein phosphatase 1
MGNRRGYGLWRWPRRGTGHAAPFEPRGPKGRLLYAIGDVHGCADLLSELISKIIVDVEASEFEGRPTLCFLGDYIDRGSSSREVVETVINLRSDGRFAVAALRGNHDQMLIDFLLDSRNGGQWMACGGAATLASYDVDPPRRRTDAEAWAAASVELGEKLPPSHRDFFEATVLAAAFGDYLLVHAGVRPGVAIEDQRAEDLFAIREAFLNHPNPLPGHAVVFGHTPFPEPINRTTMIGIDTGAFASGVLTAVRLFENGRRFLSTSPV